MRLNRLAAKLYPKWWRERYGEEFAALLDDARPGLLGTLDICKGAITMQLTTWSTKRILAIGALAGLVIATGAALLVRPEYNSEGRVQSVASSGSKDAVLGSVNSVTNSLLSRAELAALIQKLNLYPEERKRMRLEQVIQRMKDDISVSAVPTLDDKHVPVLQIKFAYPDRYDAQKTVMTMMVKYINDETTDLELLDAPNLPEEPSYPGRSKILFSGLAGGTAIGGLLALVARIRKAPPKV